VRHPPFERAAASTLIAPMSLASPAPVMPADTDAGQIDPGAAVVASAFADVPLLGTPREVAEACVAAVARVTGCPSRLEVPTPPVPTVVGDPDPGFAEAARFPAPGGSGTLWLPADAAQPPERVVWIQDALARIWMVQTRAAAQTAELDQLRFHLNALQQVARTLAVVRGAEETERLVLDSVGEVFFAWWAALYHTDGEQYTCRAVRSLRGESVAYAIPTRVVRAIAAPGQPPVIPGKDAEIRDHVPAEVAVVAPLDFGDGDAGLLILGRRMTDAAYEPHDLALLRALADSSAIALRNAELLDRLRAQATIDPLTGCHNRRGFDEIIHTELTRSARYDRELSLVLLDIDHFKRVNDDFGHEVGDHALQRIGRAVRHTFRSTDSACRFGGEEFALVFPETGKEEAMRLAERLRILIETLPPNPEVPRTLTASFGVAAYPGDARTAAELIRAADRALYQAKTGGRNRVEPA
jgi:diguanylate cyclase (GGDEF)-like protein